MMKTKVLVVLNIVLCALSVNATFLHSKQNDAESKPDIFGSILSLKKNLFGGLKGDKGSGSASAGGEASGYSYGPPAPKPVYGPPQVQPALPPKPVCGPPQVQPALPPKPVYGPPPSLPPPPPPKPVYGPPPSQPRPVYGPPQIQAPPKPVYGPPAGISHSGSSSAFSSASSGGHGNLLGSIGDLPAKLINAKRDAINKVLNKKLSLIQSLSGGIGGKSHASAGASSSSLDF